MRWGSEKHFYTQKIGDEYELSDESRGLKTYDLKLANVGGKLPDLPIRHGSCDWKDSHTAAVSAHVNAGRVLDFYKAVLKREGIVDKDMDLISVVNCTYPYLEPSPYWDGAYWYMERMWYGQTKDGDGQVKSWSRFLEIVAHELTHGVTKHTTDLAYLDESGSSTSRSATCFGVIINNWKFDAPNTSFAGWTWEIGPNLGVEKGWPLRDLSDPKRTGDPDHMADYKKLKKSDDNGGVHSNSNIHNKAAYRLMTAKDGEEYVFSPKEVADLYYDCLFRLGRVATFAKVLQALVDAALSYYKGPAATREAKIKRIRSAYEETGIKT